MNDKLVVGLVSIILLLIVTNIISYNNINKSEDKKEVARLNKKLDSLKLRFSITQGVLYHEVKLRQQQAKQDSALLKQLLNLHATDTKLIQQQALIQTKYQNLYSHQLLDSLHKKYEEDN